MPEKLTHEEVLNRLKPYDFTILQQYKNNSTEMTFLHIPCGTTFETTYDKFTTYKDKCPLCERSNSKRWTEDILKKKVDLETNGEYEALHFLHDKKSHMQVLHKTCGLDYPVKISDFFRTDHKPNRCPECSGLLPKTESEVKKILKDLVGDEYTFDFINGYQNNITKFKVIHNDCGRYYKSDYMHFVTRGQRCICKTNKNSKLVIRIRDYLNTNDLSFKEEVKLEGCKYKSDLKFDFAVLNEDNSIKFLIEADGEQHFMNSFGKSEEEFKEQLIRDEIKNEFCKNNNYKLLRIKYTQLNNVSKLIESMFND